MLACGEDGADTLAIELDGGRVIVIRENGSGVRGIEI
jgi:hypothetical protein